MISKEKIRDFIRRAHETARSHGFHDVERSNSHFMMLVVSEIGEMVEADRKSCRAVRSAVDYADNHKLDDVMWRRVFERDIKDTLEDELADVCIRLFDFLGLREIFPVVYDAPQSSWDETFGILSVCEQCYILVGRITSINDWSDEQFIAIYTGAAMMYCFAFAEHHGFDLEWHINQKMRYNESRQKKHGKQY